MATKKWKVFVLWSTGQMETREFPNTRDLKRWLEHQAFCVKHDCPLPVHLSITEER